MGDKETSSANDELSRSAWAKEQDGSATAPDVTSLDYDHVLLDLLDGAPACMVEQVMRLYPDLPGRPGISEAEVLLKRVAHPDAS